MTIVLVILTITVSVLIFLGSMVVALQVLKENRPLYLFVLFLGGGTFALFALPSWVLNCLGLIK